MKKLAENGDVGAQLRVGLSYFLGEYVVDGQDGGGTSIEVDYRQAVYWLRKAAEGGDSYAQWHLGGMYNEGKGVERDVNEAARWFLKAAEAGNIQARVNIAIYFYEGTGVVRDYDKAYAWGSLAAFQGNKNAKSLVQKLIPDLEDRDRANALAVEYFKTYGVPEPDESEP